MMAQIQPDHLKNCGSGPELDNYMSLNIMHVDQAVLTEMLPISYGYYDHQCT